jgi:alpha-D-ribose 1-methylphosphonate 5-triphosphate diphosphatase
MNTFSNSSHQSDPSTSPWPTSPSTTLTNARLVLPDETFIGTLHMENGLIKDISRSSTSALGAIDCAGDYLLPGMVELHTDNLERHLMPRPKTYWAELPALVAHDAELIAAGITTVFDSIGIGEADETSLRGKGWDKVLEALAIAQSHHMLRSDHHLHVRCELPSEKCIELFRPFEAHPALRLISLMDHTPGQRQFQDIEKARVYYMGKKAWSKQYFEERVAAGPELQEKNAKPNRAYFIAFAKAHQIALASHDDATLEHVQQALDEGLQICEFPTSVTAAQAAHQGGLAVIMGAPNMVRGGSHSGNVAAKELAQLGYLDILSSDYVPASLLSAAFQLIDEAHFTVSQAVATVSTHAARAIGFHDRGALEVGLRGDVIRVTPVSPAGHKTHPLVRAVWRAGNPVL